MTFMLGSYFGGGFGWLAGVGMAVAFLTLLYISNVFILIRFGSLVWTTRARVILFVLGMAGIGLMRAETCDVVTGQCDRLIGGHIGSPLVQKQTR